MLVSAEQRESVAQRTLSITASVTAPFAALPALVVMLGRFVLSKSVSLWQDPLSLKYIELLKLILTDLFNIDSSDLLNELPVLEREVFKRQAVV
jgi:hypothetical protein